MNTNTPQQQFICCRAMHGTALPSQPWVAGVAVEFCYLPGGRHEICAGFRASDSINIALIVSRDTADALQASFDRLVASAKQQPFGDEDHSAAKATIRFPANTKFRWDSERGVIVSGAEPTSYGAEAVNGRVYTSWSPEFSTDADYAGAILRHGHYTFPPGVRGAPDNPARVTGVNFVVGALTNRPAFKEMPPIKARRGASLTEAILRDLAVHKIFKAAAARRLESTKGQPR